MKSGGIKKGDHNEATLIIQDGLKPTHFLASKLHTAPFVKHKRNSAMEADKYGSTGEQQKVIDTCKNGRVIILSFRLVSDRMNLHALNM